MDVGSTPITRTMILSKSKKSYFKSKYSIGSIGWKTGRGDIYLLCPFHNEKTPSCAIHAATPKYFHCYGCGVSGESKKLFKRMKINIPLPQSDYNQLEFAFVADLELDFDPMPF